MGKLFSIKRLTGKYEDDDMEAGEEYVELDTNQASKANSKVLVRPFVMEDFSDIKPILNSLREGYTIALVNIRPLKDKDLVELKRAINKLKKTCDALDGDVAGFGDDYVVACPSFARVHRSTEAESKEYED